MNIPDMLAETESKINNRKVPCYLNLKPLEPPKKDILVRNVHPVLEV